MAHRGVPPRQSSTQRPQSLRTSRAAAAHRLQGGRLDVELTAECDRLLGFYVPLHSHKIASVIMRRNKSKYAYFRSSRTLG